MISSSPSSFDHVFETKTAANLVSIKGDKGGILHSISDETSVEEAMLLMQTHRLRAIPVYQVAMARDAESPAKRVRYQNFISMLTLLEILTFATLRPLFVDQEPKDSQAARSRRKVLLQQSKGSDLLHRPVSDVLNLATTTQKIKEFSSDDGLLPLLQVLTHETHHALVKHGKEPNSPVDMVTHSDALKLMLDTPETRKLQDSITCGQVMSRQAGSTVNQRDVGIKEAPLYIERERSAFSCYKAMFLGKVLF
jgi:hypothetical protein